MVHIDDERSGELAFCLFDKDQPVQAVWCGPTTACGKACGCFTVALSSRSGGLGNERRYRFDTAAPRGTEAATPRVGDRRPRCTNHPTREQDRYQEQASSKFWPGRPEDV